MTLFNIFAQLRLRRIFLWIFFYCHSYTVEPHGLCVTFIANSSPDTKLVEDWQCPSSAATTASRTFLRIRADCVCWTEDFFGDRLDRRRSSRGWRRDGSGYNFYCRSVRPVDTRFARIIIVGCLVLFCSPSVSFRTMLPSSYDLNLCEFIPLASPIFVKQNI